MAWMIVWGVLAAWGLMYGIWSLFGWLFSEKIRAVTLVFREDDRLADGVILRWRWLRSVGLLNGKLIVVGPRISDTERRILKEHNPDVEFCSMEALPALLELERNHLG